MASTTRATAKSVRGLGDRIRLLHGHYGATKSPAPRDPFALLLWEYVAYLTDDADRAVAFARLGSEVGTTPEAISAAPIAVLATICRSGGAIAYRPRAERMQEVARRVLQRFAGDLVPVMKLPYPEARRVLKTFPSIGWPGADKILLLTASRPILALDSNALRVLLRLGYGFDHKSYDAAYASAQTAAMAELKHTVPSLLEASLLLRRHGQQICRRSAPHCVLCPLRLSCPSASPSVGPSVS